MNTRQDLIEIAERLYATQGIDAVSLRQIAAEAGARNHSAAQYHFSDKTTLVQAVFAHRLGPIEEARGHMLEARGADPGLRDFVAAIVLPAASVIFATPKPHYFRFLVQARSLIDPVAHAGAAPHFVTAAIGVRTILARDLPSPVAAWRGAAALSLYVDMLAFYESRLCAGEPSSAAADYAQDVVNVVTGMLEAPCEIR